MMGPAPAGRAASCLGLSKVRVRLRLPSCAARCFSRVLHVRRSGPPLAGTVLQPSCDFGNVPALKAGALKLVLARLAGAVAACDRGGAIRGAAGDLVHPGLA